MQKVDCLVRQALPIIYYADDSRYVCVIMMCFALSNVCHSGMWVFLFTRFSNIFDVGEFVRVTFYTVA